MRRSTIVAVYRADVKKVWDIVTDNANFAWRSDLSGVQAAEDGRTFVETTKGGYRTTFTITRKEPFSCYEFDMENKNFSGHWTGVFSPAADNGTRIEFTEELRVKNPLMELLSYVALPLRKMQRAYAEDLRQALGEGE
ncbi:MAG: SRPBCC family protein [Gracilibacteraceae bacterium]|jgi:hypothetical protein|nr:SRPBCC family protein [Gracilibacteraceae bacterium]